MTSRRGALICLAALFITTSGSAAIAGEAHFDRATFEAAQAAGKLILVEIAAPWCPVCKAQAPILSRLRSQARFG